jgi:hypothetical protein
LSPFNIALGGTSMQQLTPRKFNSPCTIMSQGPSLG